MDPMDCCRTCISAKALNPIFCVPNQSDKYLEILTSITGLQILHNDNLPQKMCTTCVSFLKNIIDFRKQCHKAHTVLMQRLKDSQFYSIKTEKYENLSCSDVNNYSDVGANIIYNSNTEDFNDHADFAHVNNDDDEETMIVVEHTVEEVLKKGLKIEILNVNEKLASIKSVQVKTKRNEKKIEKYLEYNDETLVNDDEIKTEVDNDQIITEEVPANTIHKYEYGSSKNKVICEHCGKEFRDRRRLLMHCKAKHGYTKTDKCSYCSYTGISAESVKIHERLHTGEKPYVCEVCSACFHRKSSYLQHKPIHLTEKTVQCDICPALFKSVTLMKIHKVRHKPRAYKHKCLICGCFFGKRWHCLRHLQRIHGVTEDKNSHLERVKLNDMEK